MAADVYKALNDPKRSGLDPQMAIRLAAIGATVVEADVTGVGRDAYPDYWAGGRYQPCCQSITVRQLGSEWRLVHPELLSR